MISEEEEEEAEIEAVGAYGCNPGGSEVTSWARLGVELDKMEEEESEGEQGWP